MNSVKSQMGQAMPQESLTTDERQILRKQLMRLHEQSWGVAIGSVLGFGLFIATLTLVIRGGDDVGKHLNLLNVYLPGYRVTVLGSFIGFVYAFVFGYAMGRIVVTIYNYLVNLRQPSSN